MSNTTPPWINIKETADGFQYAERKGKDSVAFIIVDGHRNLYLLNQYNPALDKWVLGAFTGSISDPTDSLLEHVMNEVDEEAGIPRGDIKHIDFVGRYVVCTQMNQHCHLYIVHLKGHNLALFNSSDDVREIKNDIQMYAYPNLENKIFSKVTEDWRAKLLIIEEYND